jgi:hypothetical protein
MKRIVDNIPDIQKSLKNYQILKRKLNKEKRRLKLLYDKYAFLPKIISTDVDDFKLEDFILKLFNDLNYNTKKPKSKRDFDLIITLNQRTIGVEVKNGNLPNENEMFQARKYAIRHKRKSNKIMHPLIIWNNVKTNQEFDSFRIEDAEGNKYGILTTKELIKGYLKVKQGFLKLYLFDYLINKPGLIKFSSRFIKKLDSGMSG